MSGITILGGDSVGRLCLDHEARNEESKQCALSSTLPNPVVVLAENDPGCPSVHFQSRDAPINTENVKKEQCVHPSAMILRADLMQSVEAVMSDPSGIKTEREFDMEIPVIDIDLPGIEDSHSSLGNMGHVADINSNVMAARNMEHDDDDFTQDVKNVLIFGTEAENLLAEKSSVTSQSNSHFSVFKGIMTDEQKKDEKIVESKYLSGPADSPVLVERRRSRRTQKPKKFYVDSLELECEFSNDIVESYNSIESGGRSNKLSEIQKSMQKKKKGRPKKERSSSILLPSQNKNRSVPSGNFGVLNSGLKSGEKVDPKKKAEQHRCKDCNMAFVSPLKLKKHELSCKELQSTSNLPYSSQMSMKSKHVCPVCNKCFAKRNGVKRHLSMTHGNLLHISCSLCQVQVGDIDDIYNHMDSQHRRSDVPPSNENLGYISCPVCGEHNQKLGHLKQHVVNTHSNMLKVTCALCQRMVGTSLDYLQHYYTYHVSSANQGDVCSTPVPSSTSHKGTTDTSHIESELICVKCNKVVDNYKLLILHMLSHKLNENIVLVGKDCHDQLRNDCLSHSDEVPISNGNLSESGDGSNSKPLDEFPLSLSKLPIETYTRINERFSSLGYDLIVAFNRSLRIMSEMSSKLNQQLQWDDLSCPKDKDDLSLKLNKMLQYSSSITNIGKYLLLVLEESKQLKGKDLHHDSEEEKDVEDDSNTIEENDVGDDDKMCNRKESLESKVSRKCPVEIPNDVDERSNNSQSKLMIEANCNNMNGRLLADESEVVRDVNHLEKSGDQNSCKQVMLRVENYTDNFTAADLENQSRTEVVSDMDDRCKDTSCDQSHSAVRRPMKSKHKPIKKKKKYVCKKCGREFQRNYAFKRHQLVHQDARPYPCKLCSLAFKTPTSLRLHSTVHLRDNKYKCDFCDWSSRTLSALHKHMDSHNTEHFFPCDTCKHQARTSYDLAVHKRKHEPMKCKDCDFHARHIYELKMHERKIHKNLSCSECDYTCCTNYQLKRHFRKHMKQENEEIFCCELCGVTFNNQRKLNYHVLRHSNKTPLSCPHCDYKCSSRSSYDGHMLKHSGLRPYICSICGAGFRRSNYLKNHALIHSDEKRFVCKTCGKGFKYKYNFKEHEMIHTGEKKFKCHLCDFACRRKKLLRLHLEKHKERGSDVEGSENELEAS